MKTKILVSLIAFAFLMTGALGAMANKTSVTITAPASAKIGEEITITLNVKHMGNTSSHYTDWVVLKVNGKEIKKWVYAKTNLPENQNFTLTFKFKVTGNLLIEAEGHCNLHGSAGIAKTEVKATE